MTPSPDPAYMLMTINDKALGEPLRIAKGTDGHSLDVNGVLYLAAFFTFDYHDGWFELVAGFELMMLLSTIRRAHAIIEFVDANFAPTEETLTGTLQRLAPGHFSLILDA